MLHLEKIIVAACPYYMLSKLVGYGVGESFNKTKQATLSKPSGLRPCLRRVLDHAHETKNMLQFCFHYWTHDSLEVSLAMSWELKTVILGRSSPLDITTPYIKKYVLRRVALVAAVWVGVQVPRLR